MNTTNNLHLAVSGNIGAGKTTLVQKLAKHFDWKMHLEAVDNNPYLADFYQDMPDGLSRCRYIFCKAASTN